MHSACAPRLFYNIQRHWRYERSRCRSSHGCIKHLIVDTISVLLFFFVAFQNTVQVYALVPCNTTEYCELTYMSGSECIVETGYCSNAFYKKGCLSKLQAQNKSTKQRNIVRVCSSSDPPEAEKLGYCVSAKPPFNYTEIRLLGNNWESVFFETWIAQILLSEMLGVPTSVDTGYSDLAIDFYDEHDRFDYGKGYDWDALKLASEVGDCRLVQQPQNKSEHKSCGHVSLEVWIGQFETGQKLRQENIIENPPTLGVLGDGGWFVPAFTGIRDPTLLHYLGLRGEENRQKLAQTFKRPTTWIDYCTEISETNCTDPDNVALRPPSDETEEGKYFASGLYTGHFRYTEENNCTLWPENCTGHAVDYPCGWSSTFEQQTHHLEIALRSSGPEPYCRGYPYSQMVEIWHAANATKSDVVMVYWTPDTLVQRFFGSEAEFLGVSLPQATEECLDSRIKSSDRCQPNETLRIGVKEGACGDSPHALQKFISSRLYEITNDPAVSDVLHSPAYHAIQNFQITGLQLTTLFAGWLTIQNGGDEDKILGPREAICQWVVDNYDVMESFLPLTYPRTVVEGEDYAKEPMFYIALIVAICALLFMLAVSVALYKARKRRAIVVAQVEFMFLLIGGLMIVQIGSVSLAVPPSNGSCVLAAWAVNLGYTMELIPLIVKVSAINALMSAARLMKRTKIKRLNLFVRVAVIATGMIIYLTVWTIMDPPNKMTDFELTDTTNDVGEYVVQRYHFCRSDEMYWSISALVWRSILLLWATVLAFQTRKSPINLNESKQLAIMVYSQASFLIWSLLLFSVQSKLGGVQTARYISLVQSLDVTMVLCIYIIPKLLIDDEQFDAARRNLTESKIRASIQVGSLSEPGRTDGNASGPASEYDTSNGFSMNNMVVEDSRESKDPQTLLQMTESLVNITNPEEQNLNAVNIAESHPSSNEEQTTTSTIPSSNQEDQPASVSFFDSRKDHVVFIVNYRNHDGNDEMLHVKCFNDKTRIDYYREEGEHLLEEQHPSSYNNNTNVVVEKTEQGIGPSGVKS